MKLTRHAKQRQRQRGLSDLALKLIEEKGRYEKAPGGLMRIFLGNKEYQEIVQELKRVIQMLDKVKGGTMIINGDDVVTVYKRSNKVVGLL
jgi:hypothetical protein